MCVWGYACVRKRELKSMKYFKYEGISFRKYWKADVMKVRNAVRMLQFLSLKADWFHLIPLLTKERSFQVVAGGLAIHSISNFHMTHLLSHDPGSH